MVLDYDMLVAESGSGHVASGWGSSGSRQARFDCLLRKGFDQGDSILDVGCSDAELFLKIHELPGDVDVTYSGVDQSEGMIQAAKERLPGLDLQVGDALKLEGQYDWVLASGLFGDRGAEGIDFVHEAVKSMWDVCTVGVAFNFLSSLGGSAENEGEAGFLYIDPKELISWCSEITPHVETYADYLPHDVTIFMLR